VGEPFQGAPAPLRRDAILRFVLDGRTSAVVLGREGADVAAIARPASPGLSVVAFESRPAYLELPADRFERYLAEEGLDHVLALRAARGLREAPSREWFSRNARVLLAAGGNGEGHDTPAGLTLEIVVERNPSLAGPGDTLPVRLLYRGKPLVGALVIATPRVAPGSQERARTGDAGRAEVTLTHAGVWLLTAVHMVEREDGAWRSHWTSLTFEVPVPASME
jgi:hypothetical protein